MADQEPDRRAPGFNPTRREMIAGAMMIGAASAAFARLPRTPVVGLSKGDADGALPRQFGQWSAIPPPDTVVLPPEDERAASAAYDQQVIRTYQNTSQQQVMFLVAYSGSQSSTLMLHRPESCYPGSGFTIVDNRPVDIAVNSAASIHGRFLTTQLDSRIEQVLYWTRLGNEMPVDWDAQRWSIARQALQGKIPDGALVRMSVITPNASGALATLRNFALDLVRHAGSEGRGLLLGPANRDA